jgi:hypothetical protein
MDDSRNHACSLCPSAQLSYLAIGPVQMLPLALHHAVATRCEDVSAERCGCSFDCLTGWHADGHGYGTVGARKYALSHPPHTALHFAAEMQGRVGL